MAAPPVAADFLAAVQKSGLVAADKLHGLFPTPADAPADPLHGLFPTPADAPADPRKAAVRLLRAGLLTAFQARQLLAGKSRGLVLGVYRILGPIGRGGMGRVFLAEHAGLGRKVALKVLPAADARVKLHLERFRREARAAAALDHPNIVRLHDSGEAGGVHYLVMEHIDGTDLRSLMAKTGPVPFGRAAHYVAMAAAGLQHAHDKGFVHRDIKPANLILDRDGRVKILDMGLTRSLTDHDDDLTGQLGGGAEVAGTVDYVSPEQAMLQPVDERGDIYSLGATFFALVAGRPPFRGTTAQKLRQHQLTDAPLLTTVNADVPAPLAAVVAKMLAKKPLARYQSATDVIDALGPWLPAPTTRTDPAPRPPDRWRRGWRVGIAAGMLAAAAAGGTAVAVWSRGHESKSAPAAVAPPAGPLFRLDLTNVRPGRVMHRDGRFLTPVTRVVPMNVTASCWRPDSDAEFRAEPTAAGPALGVVNRNDTLSAQFAVALETRLAPLEPGRAYRVRIEYRADHDAAGTLSARTSDYTVQARTPLPPTGGEWRWAELTVTRPAHGPLHAMVENTTVGEENVLAFRRLDVMAGE